MSKPLTDETLRNLLKANENASAITQHYWMARFWEQAVYSSGYSSDPKISELIVLTPAAEQIVLDCIDSTGIARHDVLLAMYGHFCWDDILVDCVKSNLDGLMQLLETEVLGEKLRFGYFWGRLLHDRISDDHSLATHDLLPHDLGWKLLDNSPIGIFQHGKLVSGPLGLLAAREHRWIPVRQIAQVYFRNGTKTTTKSIEIERAETRLAEAYDWLHQALMKRHDAPAEWESALAWFGSSQCEEDRTDYADILFVIAECFFGSERTVLLEEVLKSDANTIIRKLLKHNRAVKGLSALSPQELAGRLNEYQQLQLLLTVPTQSVVDACDRLILERRISIPTSEVRMSRKYFPARNVCFISEVSSLGIRPGHQDPFTALCLAIRDAYDVSGSSNELAWRLGSDPSRGLQVTLTDFVRREGPAEAVSKLVLASHLVTAHVCKRLGLGLSEVQPITITTVPRILWKFGFEIPRYDEVLDRLKRRLQRFQELLARVELKAGESARESIRAEGVNLFVSVEEFLDNLVSFNVWMLSSDHWLGTRFEYRVSDARSAVARILGDRIETPEGDVVWKANGENALGCQLTYMCAYSQWLDNLGDSALVVRSNSDGTLGRDEFGRPFPFLHKQLWADCDHLELERYKEAFKRTVKSLVQANVAGVRNGLDHQRDASRFPTEEQLLLCITRLQMGVQHAEQSRIYPVAFWFDLKTEKAFGSNEYVFRNRQNELFTVHRPSTVSSLPGITRIMPVIFAPVNFLGAADSQLLFKVMGESEYSRYWANYPRVIESAIPSNTDTPEVLNNDACVRDNVEDDRPANAGPATDRDVSGAAEIEKRA